MNINFVQPELNTQEQAQAKCDEIAEVRMPQHSQGCFVMARPNGKFTYVVGNGYPRDLVKRLNARVLATRHIGQQWELSDEGS
jgi:hypothetical protein